MNNNDIIITTKLNERQKEEAAKLLFHTFSLKFINALHHNISESKTLEFFKEGVCYENGFYAILNEKVIGMIGLHLGKGKDFLIFTPRLYMKTYGFFGGLIRYYIYYFGAHFTNAPRKKDQSSATSLAILPEYRGRGIGTKLFNSVCKYSKEQGYKEFVFEVVDTNVRAKALYEQLGSVVFKYVNTALLTRKSGFNGFYFMKKVL